MSGTPTNRKTDRNGSPKIDQDPARKTDGNGAAMPAMNYYDGTANITQNNETNFMAVAQGETAAMNYVAKNANVTKRNTNNVNVMMVGFKGKEIVETAEVFKGNAASKESAPPQVGEKTDVTEISFSVRPVGINRRDIRHQIKRYTLPENTTIEDLIQRITYDLKNKIQGIRLTNDDSTPPIDPHKNLKQADIANGQEVYALLDK